MLRLESLVTFTEYVRPICLPYDSSHHANYGTMTVTGFGKTETRNSSEQMLKAEINIVNHSSCRRKYGVQGRIVHDSQICAISYDADTCNGDSGGPLMKQSETSPSHWVLVGITSFGPASCANVDFPGIYTNVNSYMDWIKAKIRL